MTDLKPKIFIGSSTAALPIAEKAKRYLTPIGDCIIWKEPHVWEANRSTFDNLLRMASYFDFGIFVAAKDDVTFTNGKFVLEPRDNVILEMSLFLGAMGRDKSFLVVENGVKLPSDFDGIYMPRFDKDDDNSIKAACEELSGKITEHYRLGHLSLYPTTALAIAYYKNFLSGLVASAQESEIIELNGIKYSDFKLKVVMPDNLRGKIREKADQFYRRHGFIENTMKTKFRQHPAWFQLDSKNAPVANVYDMPSALTGIDDAIEMILQKGFYGRTKMQEVIEQRELNNFRRVLQLQIDNSAHAAAMVEIIDEF